MKSIFSQTTVSYHYHLHINQGGFVYNTYFLANRPKGAFFVLEPVNNLTFGCLFNFFSLSLRGVVKYTTWQSSSQKENSLFGVCTDRWIAALYTQLAMTRGICSPSQLLYFIGNESIFSTKKETCPLRNTSTPRQILYISMPFPKIRRKFYHHYHQIFIFAR